MKHDFFLHIFEKLSSFIKLRAVGADIFHAYSWTGGLT